GVADAEFPGDGGGSSPDFDGDSGFAFAIGVKKTIFTDPDSETVWGTVFQFAQARRIEDDVRSVSGGINTWGNGHISLPGSGVSETEMDLYAIQLAAGPTVPLCEGVCLYGGPFLNFVEGDLEVRYDSAGNDRNNYELEQHLELGGYIGAQVEVGDPNILVGGEFLWTNEAWAIGIGATILCP
ncbi:MAG: hypothetical protein ACYTDV_13555, partial [Planctomycetota bacterium]